MTEHLERNRQVRRKHIKIFHETGRSYLQEGKRRDWIISFSVFLHLHTIPLLSRFGWRAYVSVGAFEGGGGASGLKVY